MIRNIRPLCGLLAAGLLIAQTDDASRRLVARSLGVTPIFDDLQELCDTIGGRPTGSPAAEKAVQWAARRF